MADCRARTMAGNILLVTPQPFYEDRGTPIAVDHTVRALGQLGYRVDVLAFPLGRTVRMPGVQTIRCGNPLSLDAVPIGFSWKKCVLDASLLRSFDRLLRARRYDAVHAVEEAAYMAAPLCARSGRPYIYDMASSIPSELASNPLFGSKPVQSLLSRLERTVIERAAHVICSAGLADQVKQHTNGTPVTEWWFPARLEPIQESLLDQIRSELDLQPDDSVVLYCGNFARYQGMDLLFESFAKALARRPELVLVCVGAQASERDNCLAKVPAALASRVRIVTRRPRSEIPTYLALADCLISLRPVSRNLPLKIFEYMASGKPIVATRGPAHEPLLSTRRAVLCDSTSAAIADGIVGALQPQHAETLAHNARSFAEQHFGWQSFVRLIDRLYQDALERAPLGSLARA